MYRKYLVGSFALVILIGISASFSPLFFSLSPNDRADNNAPQIDISMLQTGETKLLNAPFFSIVITKTKDSNVHSLAIPIRDGMYQLPEFDWSRPVLPCKNFIQDFGYQCLDTHDGDLLWYSYMKWDKSGAYVGDTQWNKNIPNLLVPKHDIRGNHFVYLGI